MRKPIKIFTIFLICLLMAQSGFALDEEIKCWPDGKLAISGSPEKDSPTKEQSYRFVFAEAECLRQAASRAGAEWLKTKDLLLRATKEAESGQWDSAIELAAKARFQAITSLHQAARESETWKSRVVK